MEEKPSAASQKKVQISKSSTSAQAPLGQAPNPPEPRPPRESVIPEELRRRRCHLDPTCGFVIENAIYIIVLAGTIIDICCIAFWIYYETFLPTIWNYHFARESNVQMLFLHFFCLFFNVVLFFGTTMENVLLCLSWVMMRGIWYFAALFCWIRSVDMLIFGGRTQQGKLSDEEKVLWLVTFWAYWPIMAIYAWFTVVVIVFICRIIAVSERKRLMSRQVQGIPFTDVDSGGRMSFVPMPYPAPPQGGQV